MCECCECEKEHTSACVCVSVLEAVLRFSTPPALCQEDVGGNLGCVGVGVGVQPASLCLLSHLPHWAQQCRRPTLSPSARVHSTSLSASWSCTLNDAVMHFYETRKWHLMLQITSSGGATLLSK